VPVPAVGAVRPKVASDALASLEAMASMASQTGSVIHVVVARGPGLVDHARNLAEQAGLGISVDLMASSIRVRFDGTV
jgi:hypothetical protein